MITFIIVGVPFADVYIAQTVTRTNIKIDSGWHRMKASLHKNKYKEQPNTTREPFNASVPQIFLPMIFFQKMLLSSEG